eukprot:15484301-Alexandrium_andersonii.AAC.1
MGKGDLEALKDSLWAGTLGPNDLLWIPAGMLVAERAFDDADIYGMRLAVLHPDQLVAFKSLEHAFAGAGAGLSLGEAGNKIIAALS